MESYVINLASVIISLLHLAGSSTNISVHEQFRTCCSIGLSAAYGLDSSLIKDTSKNSSHETCYEILQLGTSIINEGETEEEREAAGNHRWCEHIQHLCCLSVRRHQACQIGSDHVVKHGVRNCSRREFSRYMEKELVAVARECCLCQLVWTTNRLTSKDWIIIREQTKHSSCPGFGCCNLLDPMNRTRAVDPFNMTSIMSDDPSIAEELRTKSTQAIQTTQPTITTTTSSTYQIQSTEIRSKPSKKEDADDFSISFVGGTDFFADDYGIDSEDMLSHQMESSYKNPETLTLSPETTVTNFVSTTTEATTMVMTGNNSSKAGETVTAEGNPISNHAPNWFTGTNSSYVAEISMPTKKTPIQCQKNFIWDSEQEICVRLMTSCPIGMYLNKELKKCVTLPEAHALCPKGYRYSVATDECEDINECTEGLDLGKPACEGEYVICHNLPGSYNCSCEPGFSVANDGTCVDINECNALRNPCNAGQQCRNIIGSYQCLREVPCGYGYVLNPKTQQCEDVDECKVDPMICGKGMLCINVRGGHKCVELHCPGKSTRNKVGDCVPCPSGYTPNPETGKCDDINECTQPNRCRTWERCVNKPGYFVCEAKINCKYGTRINLMGTECEDIDECREKSFNCDSDQVCVNTHGSYECVRTPCPPTHIYDYVMQRCRCEDGYREVNGICQDIDECLENPNICPTSKTCVNLAGGHRCMRLDECQPGYNRTKPSGPCEDIDECQTGIAKCGLNMQCRNSIGSFQCVCNDGYRKLNETTCVDVDECQIFRSEESCPDPKAHCVNTEGGYICVCPDGFTWNGYPEFKCKDIDECALHSNICGKEHRCVNILGGYRCECASGYQIGEDGKTCVDIDECNEYFYASENRVPPCAQSLCVNYPGGYRCQCPDGFRLGRGNRCYDIDECHELEGVCKSNGPRQACVNLMGSYRCVSNQCPPNYVKSRLGNGFRCELEEGKTCATIGVENCAQRMDELFVELDQETSVPQILARVDTKYLPPGMIRVDLREHYAYHLNTGNQIRVSKSFLLQMSRSQAGTVEVLLLRQLPAPMNILISVHLFVSEDQKQIRHSITKLYLFVTQSPDEKLRIVKKTQQRTYRNPV